jgi:hypothetical protein
MSIPDTRTVDKHYVQQSPDWSKPVAIEASYHTVATEATDGSEQRSSRRSLPTHRQTWQTFLKGSQAYAQARINLTASLNKTLVVPLWGKRIIGVSWPTANQIDTDLTLSEYPEIRVGAFVYMVDPLGVKVPTFREITSIGGADLINFTGANADYPNIAAVSYDANSWVYPCILAIRRGAGSQTIRQLRIDESVEMWDVSEL